MILNPTARPPIDGIQYAVTFTAPCPCGTDVDWHATVTTVGAHTSEPGVCGCETVVNGGGLSHGGGTIEDVTKPRRTAIQPGLLTPSERGW